MSVSAKTAEFPTSCANRACGKALYGPVKHCPFCGSRPVQVAAVAAKASIAPTVDVKPAAAAPPVAAPVAAEKAAAVLNFDLKGVEQPEPPAKPVPSPTKTAAAPPKPKGILKKVITGLVVVAVLASYALYQLGSRQTQKQFEQNLLAGQNCLKNNRFDCALENAELALQKDSKEPRAVSLLQRAQAALERQQQSEQAQKAATAARQAANEKAQSEKAAQEQAARDQAAREQEQRDLDQRMQRQQQLLQEQLRAQQQQTEIRTPTPRPVAPARPIQGNPDANPGVVGQSLSQARSALARQDYQSAIAVANVVLTMDPGNRQAQIIIRQAEQLRTQALNRTTIE